MKTIRLTKDQLEDLRNELVAISFWDASYENSTVYNFIETTAWEARRRRLREIIRQLKRGRMDVPLGKVSPRRAFTLDC